MHFLKVRLHMHRIRFSIDNVRALCLSEAEKDGISRSTTVWMQYIFIWFLDQRQSEEEEEGKQLPRQFTKIEKEIHLQHIHSNDGKSMSKRRRKKNRNEDDLIESNGQR